MIDPSARNKLDAELYIARLDMRESALLVCREYARELADKCNWSPESLFDTRARCDAVREILKRIGELR